MTAFLAAGIASAQSGGTAWTSGDPLAQRPAMPGMDLRVGLDGSFGGVVHDLRNQPVPDARVELRSRNGSQPIASTYTNNEGRFLIDRLAVGNYDVVVTHGVTQASQEITVDGSSAPVTIRLAEELGDARAGSSSTVSVAEMKVPKKARQHLEKATALAQKQQLDEAAKETEQALALDPHYAQALALRGVLKLDKGDMRGGLDDFQSAINSDSGCVMAYTAAGSAYNALGEYDNAARSIDHALELDPRSWQAHFEMGKAELGRQRLDAALREVNRALELVSRPYPPMHLVRAHIYLDQHNYAEAKADLEDYLQKAPQDSAAARARKMLDQVNAFVAENNPKP
ncbi:MAG: tetratricopeptide repeat protein [Acidobacteria bacterium]|nr:tetratricopeptide repeat protein [Acidobacteriota bacterium]